MSKNGKSRIAMRGVHCERSRPLKPETVARIARGVKLIMQAQEQSSRSVIEAIPKTPRQ